MHVPEWKLIWFVVMFLELPIFNIQSCERQALLNGTPGSPLANIGNDSRTMRKEGEVLVRVVFDLEARRKPQVFAADAVSLWRFNQN
jgi:hypothetical protein